LPSYCPNLNLIERLWKFVKKQCLDSEYYADFTAFKTAILGCRQHAFRGRQQGGRNQERRTVATKHERKFDGPRNIEQSNDRRRAEHVDVLVMTGLDGSGRVHHVRNNNVPIQWRGVEIAGVRDLGITA